MSSLRPDSNKGHDLGSSSVKWGTLHAGDVQTETLTASGNVEIQGNLTVTGNQTSLQVTTVEAQDPLIKLARANSGDTIDIGFYGLSNDGSDKFHGLFRDADDGKFYLFKDLATEPTSTVPTLSAGNKATIVANIEGDMVGNSASASILETARDISLSGDVAGVVSFDGSQNVDIVATIQEDSVENSMILNPGYSYSDGVGAAGLVELGQTITIQGTSSEIEVSRLDGSFTIGLPTNVSGLNSLSATSLSGELTGNASTATALQTARTLSLSGDVAGSVSFDGTGNADIVSTIQPGAVENSMLANDGWGLKLDGVAQEDINLGDSLDFVAGQDLDISYNATSNALTFSLEAVIDSDTTGNAATATAQETARDFSISSSEIVASAVSYDATGNVVLAPSIQPGSVANAKLANSDIGFGNGVTSSDIALGGDVVIQGTSSEVEVGYAAGTFTIGLPDTIVADVTGNADSATALETARNFSIGAGPVQAAAVSFDGTGNVSLTSSIADDQITNAMLENDKLVIQVDSVDYDRPLGSTLKFAKGGDLTLSYSAVDNEITYNLPSSLTVDTTGNAATATAQETARDFSIDSTEMSASAVSYDATGNVVLVPSLKPGSVANSKLANSVITVGDGVASEAIALGGEFEIKGTANEIDVAWSSANNDFTISLPDTISADVSGNASSATILETARNFSIGAGPVQAAAVSFDGSGNVSLTSSIADSQITNDMLAGSIANSKLSNSSISFTDGTATAIRSLGDTIQINGTSSEVTVELDAGTNAFTIGLPDTISAELSGNASTATNLETARDFSISSSEITASAVSFDGGANVQLVPSIVPGSIANSKLANSSFTVSDTVTSEAISLGDTLYFGGTSSEVEVSYNSAINKFTFGLPDAVYITTSLDVGGAFSAGSITTTGNISASGLTATGANVTFADNLIELGVNNTDLEDIGFYGQRGDGIGGTNGFAGFVYDESQDRFMTFKSSSEPTTTVSTHTLAELQVGGLNINNEYDMPVADGTDGQVMMTDGNGNVTFESIPAQNTYPHLLVNNGSVPIGLADQSGSFSEQIVLYNGSSADQATVTLPPDPTNAFRVTIKNYDSVNTLKYQRGGTNTIEGSTASENLLTGESITLMFRNGIWYKIARFH